MKILYLLFIASSVSCNEDNKQIQETTLIEKMDSLPMKISYQTLREKCQSYVKLFTEREKFTVNEYIDIVRAYNTINLNRLREKDSVFIKYDELFFKEYLNDIAK